MALKYVIIAFSAFTLLSCSDNKSEQDNMTDTQIRGVENVNGGIPDTIATGAKPSADEKPLTDTGNNKNSGAPTGGH